MVRTPWATYTLSVEVGSVIVGGLASVGTTCALLAQFETLALAIQGFHQPSS